MEQLKLERHHNSMKMNYYGIWKNFNNFIIKLDVKPRNWEDRIVLYVTFLIQNNRKSSTIKSYISAIKAVLYNGGVKLSEDSTLFASLTRACHLKNDVVHAKIPMSLIRLLIKALAEKYEVQPRLLILYKALILTTYFGMFRIGELTSSPHIIKAHDIHIGIDKPKLMFILHTSKTHYKGDHPQIIKISSTGNLIGETCPFKALTDYLKICKHYKSDTEQFFVFIDRSLVSSQHYRRLLKDLILCNNLDPSCYGAHGMHAG